MDHPGALRHAADGEAGAVRDGFLRVRVGRHDRLAASAPPSRRELRGRGAHAGDDVRERQRRADHAGREDEHLLGVEVEQPRRLGGGRARVEQAALAGRRVRDAGVRDDGLRLRELEMLARDDHRRGEHAVDREHPGARRGNERAHEREVEAVLLADPAVHAARDEALRSGDAHTSTPVSRRPSVSSRPSARFAFWIAWPAAPLPRLSSAQTTIACPVDSVLVERDLGAVGVLHARELRRDALRQHAHDVARRRTRPRAGRAARRSGGRNRWRAGRDAPAAGAERSRRGSRAPARSPARAGACRRGTARRSRARSPRASSPSARGLHLTRPTSRRRRRSRGRSRRRAARARGSPRSRSSRGSRSAGPPAARARESRSSSRARGRGCSKPYHRG